jgi:hypothetical protein
MTTETPTTSGDTHTHPDGTGQHRARRTVANPVLWVVLIVSGALNAASNILGWNTLVGVGFGLVAVGCAVALIARHHRRRSDRRAG